MHVLSERSGPFVAVNCGALTSSLLESHLFGHVKGSFTGALRDEPGLIRSADGGTLFLDEVGDLPLPAQAALLRVLQEREVLPVGGTRPTNVDVRVIAATNKPLETLCLQGEFRSDLLARLTGYTHVLAPLRERMEDLGVLASDLLGRAKAPNAKTMRLHLHVVRKLAAHVWPQNIRELDNVLSVAVALAERGVMELSHLPEVIVKSNTKELPDSDPPSNSEELRVQILRLLEQHRGNVTFVARTLGKSRMQLHRWMQKFGIDPEAYRA
jgi:transcriptional regulator with PAS, ATPase and Fis domain